MKEGVNSDMEDSTFNSLRCKEIININDGSRLGYVEDIAFDGDKGTITELEVPAKPRILGIFPHGEMLRIPWTSIERIGDDIIIVACDDIKRSQEKGIFAEFFGKLFR